jgi:hypothetical protein
MRLRASPGTRGLALASVLAVLFALVFGNAAFAVHDLGLFELDRNTLDDASVAGDDWNTLYNGGGSATDFSLVFDKVGTAGDTSYYAGGGSKDNRDLNLWKYKANDVSPDKDDIVNAFAAAYKDTDLILYFGADRFANNGDAQMGFWFFVNPVKLGPGGQFVDNAGNVAHHTDGDLLILVNFTQGGTLGTAQVLEWQGGPSGGPVPVLGGPNADCTTIPAGDDFCATTNLSALPGEPVWPYAAKGGSTSYPPVSFFEGGVNIGAIPGAGKCFPSFLAETRSSQAIGAQLKDFALGSFELCAPNTTLTASASASKVYSGDAVTLTFSEENTGNEALTNVTVTTDDPNCAPTYSSGDTNNNGNLDVDETWQFTCTIHPTATTTITAIGSGTGVDSGTTVTFCTVPPDPNTICDPDETAAVTVTVITPSTNLVENAAITVTFTYLETNDGDDPLTNPSVSDPGCVGAGGTVTLQSKSGGNQDDILDPGETWTFTCTVTTTSGADLTLNSVGTGSGTDSLGNAVTFPGDPQEQESVDVTVTHHHHA